MYQTLTNSLYNPSSSSSSSTGTSGTYLVLSSNTPTVSTNTGALQVVGGVGIGGGIAIGGEGLIIGDLIVGGTTQAVSTATGALVVDGGVGIGKNIAIGGTTLMMEDVIIGSTTQAVNNTTGALVIDGGVGIAKNLYVAGNIVATGTVSGTIEVNSGTYPDIGCILMLESTQATAAGALEDGDNLFKFATDVSGNMSRGSAIGLTAHKWRNISGFSLGASGRIICHFQRVS